MTQLSILKEHHIGIHCSWCNHSKLTSVAKILTMVPHDYTFQQLKRNAKCSRCGRKKADLRVLYVTPESAKYHEENPSLDL